MENLFDLPMCHIAEIGTGQVISRMDDLHLRVNPTGEARYSNAQISDYRSRSDFRWRPPLRLSITAWMDRPAAEVRGTAGFGFWNHPFVPGERGFRLPRAVWFFFASPPNDMRLAQDMPGHGWKVATFDALRPAFFGLLPTAPVGVLLMRIPALYRRLWPVGQRALGVSEKGLDLHLLAEPHRYTLDWQPHQVIFSLDGVVIHTAPVRVGGPLGFVVWMDTQYAIVTPQGQFGFGLLPVTATQTFLIRDVQIERG